METQWYYVIGIFAFMAVYAVIYICYEIFQRKKLAAYVAEHPEVSLVKVKAHYFHIISETLTVCLIAGENPKYGCGCTGGINRSVYLTPGKHVLNVQYSKCRPGFMHKTVTTTYDPIDIEVTVEQAKTYELSFNRKSEEYEFHEVIQKEK